MDADPHEHRGACVLGSMESCGQARMDPSISGTRDSFLRHVSPRAIVAPVRATAFAYCEERVPFDLWIGQRDQPIRVARTERVQNLASQLHVLLRHRLLLETGGFERFTFQPEPVEGSFQRQVIL